MTQDFFRSGGSITVEREIYNGQPVIALITRDVPHATRLGFSAAQARQLAALLLRYATEIEAGL